MRIIFVHTLIIVTLSLMSCTNKQSVQHPLYEGKDISDIAEIKRDKHTKDASFIIETAGKWKLYAGSKEETIDYETPVLEGEGSGTYALSEVDKSWNYFQLATEDSKAIFAERHLPMAKGFNFRDLGGFRTQDGRFVKWGQLFRSDDLHSLTENDLDYLSSIPLVSIVDFRSEDEMKQAPDNVPSSVKKEYPFSITPGNLTASRDLSSLANVNLDSVMMEINKMLVTDPAAITRYKDFFALLQNESNVPLMFHCSAGKDRTGMAAALVLLALGVDEATVMHDYLSSNSYLKEKYAAHIEASPSLQPLFSVKPAFLQAGLEQIKATYGSVEHYLESVLEVDIAKFREMYLYPVN